MLDLALLQEFIERQKESEKPFFGQFKKNYGVKGIEEVTKQLTEKFLRGGFKQIPDPDITQKEEKDTFQDMLILFYDDKSPKPLSPETYQIKGCSIRIGIDPSEEEAHLGHSAPLYRLRELQDHGSHVYLLMGTGTAMWGDPTDRDTKRKKLTLEKTLENSKGVLRHLVPVLNPEKTSVVFNHEWFEAMTVEAFDYLCSKHKIGNLMNRKNFRERDQLDASEFLYPLLQGIDSLILGVYIGAGGQDQELNELVGRDLQKAYGLYGQKLILAPLIRGINNKIDKGKTKDAGQIVYEKMGKTDENAVPLGDPLDTYSTLYESMTRRLFEESGSDLIDNWVPILTEFDFEKLNDAREEYLQIANSFSDLKQKKSKKRGRSRKKKGADSESYLGDQSISNELKEKMEVIEGFIKECAFEITQRYYGQNLTEKAVKLYEEKMSEQRSKGIRAAILQNRHSDLRIEGLEQLVEGLINRRDRAIHRLLDKAKETEYREFKRNGIVFKGAWTEEELAHIDQKHKKTIISYFDVRSNILHLGNVKTLDHLREFQEKGYHIKIVFGDYTTGVLGDNGTNFQEAQQNAKALQSQIENLGILNLKETSFYKNSLWYQNMSLISLLQLYSNVNMSKKQRESFDPGLSVSSSQHDLRKAVDVLILGGNVLTATSKYKGLYDGEYTRQSPYVDITAAIHKSVGLKKPKIDLVKFLRGVDGERMEPERNNIIAVRPDDPISFYSRIMETLDSVLITDEQIELGDTGEKNPYEKLGVRSKDFVEMSREAKQYLSTIDDVTKEILERKMSYARSIVQRFCGNEGAIKAEKAYIKKTEHIKELESRKKQPISIDLNDYARKDGNIPWGTFFKKGLGITSGVAAKKAEQGLVTVDGVLMGFKEYSSKKGKTIYIPNIIFEPNREYLIVIGSETNPNERVYKVGFGAK